MTQWHDTPQNLLDTASRIYDQLILETSCATDAAEVLTVVWVTLYVTSRNPDAPIEAMLEGLTNTIRMNVAMYDAEVQGGMQ